VVRGQYPAMSTRLGAAVLGALGGILLAAGGGLSYVAGQEPEWHRLLAVAGYTVAVWALILLGYGVAPRAPVWLRLVVAVAVPVLGASVWQVVDQAIHDAGSGWQANAASWVLAGILILVIAALTGRTATHHHGVHGYQPTHR
jgi:hypothetical protein